VRTETGPTAARISPLKLAVGDVIAVSLFAPIGLLSHDEGITLAGLARNVLPVAIGFIAAALLVGTWRRPGWKTLVPAWLLGITAGVFVRAAILGHGYGKTTFTFLAVTLVVTGLLLAAWRAGVWFLARQRRR
jgi:hypothetical protein